MVATLPSSVETSAYADVAASLRNERTVVLTTPPRLKAQQRSRGSLRSSAYLQPLHRSEGNLSRSAADADTLRPATAPEPSALDIAQQSKSNNAKKVARLSESKSASAGALLQLQGIRPTKKFATDGANALHAHEASDDGSEDSVTHDINLQENIRLRKRLSKQARELQETKNEMERKLRELRLVRNEVDELRLKLSNLERIDRAKSADLLEERRKSDELSKQVKAMSQNLLSIVELHEGDGQNDVDVSGLQKRCFKLVQQNTALTVKARLLSRQKGWAEAKARVLQNEVTSVYLGTHKQVKDTAELELATDREFHNPLPSRRKDSARIYKLMMPAEYRHKELVGDFLTHLTHTEGNDLQSYLEGNKVYSEVIRNECLNGLGREFFACCKQNRQLPHIVRAVERIIHLGDYVAAFESFAAEIVDLLECSHARLWVVDHVQHCLWTSWKEGDGFKTLTLPQAKGPSGAEVAGQGLVVAACATQRVVNVADARNDPRWNPENDTSIGDGNVMSAMCVPIVHQSRTRVVLQVVNKLHEPHFDPETDTRVLRLLGKVSMEVLKICQENSAASKNALRKENLLSLFSDHIPCEQPMQLLHALEHGLHDVFLSQAAALHTVSVDSNGRGYTTRLQIMSAGGGKKLTHTASEGLQGVVGQVVRTKNQVSDMGSKLENTPYDAQVDLAPVDGRAVLHTVPICEGAQCLAVVQFVCPERDETAIGDDGDYHPENTSHFRILTVLLTFVQKHLFVLSKKSRRASMEADDDEDWYDQGEGELLGQDNRHKDVQRGPSSGAKVSNSFPDRRSSLKHALRPDKLVSVFSQEELNDKEQAALMIQKNYRSKHAREKVKTMIQQRKVTKVQSLQKGLKVGSKASIKRDK